jgi:hypothetical protein
MSPICKDAPYYCLSKGSSGASPSSMSNQDDPEFTSVRDGKTAGSSISTYVTNEAARLRDSESPFTGPMPAQSVEDFLPIAMPEAASDPELERLTQILNKKEGLDDRKSYLCPTCEKKMWYNSHGCDALVHQQHHAAALEVVAKDLPNDNWPRGSTVEEYHIWHYVNGKKSPYEVRGRHRVRHINRTNTLDRMQAMRKKIQSQTIPSVSRRSGLAAFPRICLLGSANHVDDYIHDAI